MDINPLPNVQISHIVVVNGEYKGESMKVDRLFSIVHILLNKGKVTAGELADEFEVSTRTIYRDIDTLSMSGVPIYTNKGTGGGICLLDNFVLNKSVVSEEEKNSIILGLEVLRATEYDETDTAIRKIKGLFDANNDDFVEVDFSGFDNEPQKRIFQEIKTALKKNQTVEIVYKNSVGELTKRKINPLKLIFKKHSWYLIAYCHARYDYRTFRISRVRDIKSTGETFDRKEYDLGNYVLTSHGIQNMKMVRVTLDAKALYRVEEEFGESMIVHKDSDVLVVQFESELDEWLPNYMMSYADYLIEVEPKELKDKIKQQAKKILDI